MPTNIQSPSSGTDDVEELAICATVDLGGGNVFTTPALRRVVREADGTETVTYISGSGGDITTTLAGWTPGECETPQRLVLCDANGDPFIQRHGQATQANPTGIQYFTLQGAPITPAPQAPYQVCGASDDVVEYQTTVEDVTGGAVTTFTPNGDMVAWSARSRNASDATVQVNGGAVLPLDLGESIGASLSGHDTNDILTDTFIIDSGSGAVRVVITRRV